MNRTEYLLTCLGEENSEISHRCSKAIRFGVDEVEPGQTQTNGERIVQEYVDSMAVLQVLLEDKVISWPSVQYENMIKEKKLKIKKYMEYSKSKGTLA